MQGNEDQNLASESSGFLKTPELELALPEPAQGQTHWNVHGVGNFDLEGNFIEPDSERQSGK